MVSDNVFVGTVYINEVKTALVEGRLSLLANCSTCLLLLSTQVPTYLSCNTKRSSCVLFLLTSALAPLIRPSYGRMVIMAPPYTIVC
ncbi:hypothetical protein OH492_07110 [Vibrio chagasii]|nr:hypothetical protein [Vibrio chagasii]